MKFIGSFTEFSQRVVSAARKGGLPEKELKKLDRLLTRTGKRNAILSKGILSALSAGGASPQDVAKFGQLLVKAEDRISSDKKPFTESESKDLSDLFRRAYVSTKTVKWFSAQIDELVAQEISDAISGKHKLSPVIPSKKVTFEKNEERKRLKS